MIIIIIYDDDDNNDDGDMTTGDLETNGSASILIIKR